MSNYEKGHRKYVDMNQLNSNIYKLEHSTFVVKVAWIDLMDVNEIKRYGTPTFGDPEDDKKNANEKVTVALTIPRLLELFRKRIPFHLTDKSNEHLIYNIIHTHLYEWREYAEQSKGMKFKLDKIPYQDLKDLSEMASVLFASRDRTKDVRTQYDTIHSILDVPELITGSSIFEENRLIEESKQQEENEKAPHLAETSVLDQIFIHRYRG